jgi:hypothetical protein
MNELALTESPSLRAQYADRVDVLDKVKALTLLPDDMHMSTELVADYFEVDFEAIKSIVRRNRAELEGNGMETLRGEKLREFKRAAEGRGDPLPKNLNALTLFVRRSILNVGQLLTDSPIAEAVRKHLLDSEEVGRADISRTKPIDPFEPDTYTWKETCTVVRQQFGVRVAVPKLRRTLRSAGVLTQNFEPKADYSDWFWFTGTAHEVFSHRIPALFSLFQSTEYKQRAFGSERPSLPRSVQPEIPFGDDK